eukprot:5485297-Prymnesium_polylepis.2
MREAMAEQAATIRRLEASLQRLVRLGQRPWTRSHSQTQPNPSRNGTRRMLHATARRLQPLQVMSTPWRSSQASHSAAACGPRPARR